MRWLEAFGCSLAIVGMSVCSIIVGYMLYLITLDCPILLTYGLIGVIITILLMIIIKVMSD